MNDARLKLFEKPHAFRDLAAHLRVLVCKKASNRPLLLDLMDDTGFHAIVEEASRPCHPFRLSRSVLRYQENLGTFINGRIVPQPVLATSSLNFLPILLVPLGKKNVAFEIGVDFG